MRSAYISVLEAAYSLDEAESVWLERILRAAKPLIDQGLGVLGYTFDTRSLLSSAHGSMISLGVSDGFLEAVRQSMFQTAPEVSQAAHRPPMSFRYSFARSFFSKAESEGKHVNFTETLGWPHGVEDMLGIFAVDPSAAGCFIGAPYPKTGVVQADTARAWTSVSAHIANAARLRRNLHAAGLLGGERAPDTIPGVDAILADSGDIEFLGDDVDADGVRPLLQHSVRQMMTARAGAVGHADDPNRALSVWRGMVDGRWSLVDHYESGGRRYIVAHRNAASFPDPRKLTARERVVAHYLAMAQNHSEIAYAMGLEVSTISSHVASIQAKLGSRSRVELAELLATMRKLGGDDQDDEGLK